jgi:hypothetical protein
MAEERAVTVYVDDMRAPFRGMLMCHMLADTDDELHDMASLIGMRREWFQGDHYDVPLPRRALAVRLGAVEVTLRVMGCMRANRRRLGRLGDPATARAVFLKNLRASGDPVPRSSCRDPSQVDVLIRI